MIIWTETGQKISLTSRHLIPIMSNGSLVHKFVFAETIKIGDYVYVQSTVDKNEIIAVKVHSISTGVQQGYYSPITYDGEQKSLCWNYYKTVLF